MFYEITLGDWIEVGLCVVLGFLGAFVIFDGWDPVRVVVAAASALALGCVIAAQVKRDLRSRK